MTAIQIVMDTKPTLKSLTLFQSQQYPFALAKSLTKTAQIAQGRVKRVTERKFTLRNKFTNRGVRIKPSLKSDVKRGLAESMVFTDNKITDHMVGHEAGQNRTSRKTKLIAVPSRVLKKQGFRTATGRVKKKFRPGELLKDKGTNRGGSNQRRRSGQRKATIIEINSGLSLIVRRKNPKERLPLEILYILKRNVKIDKEWAFETNIRVSVRFNFERTFSKELNRAIAQAR